MILRDFNDLLLPEEKRGKHPRPRYLLNGFWRAIDDCGLLDIVMEGYKLCFFNKNYIESSVVNFIGCKREIETLELFIWWLM